MNGMNSAKFSETSVVSFPLLLYKPQMPMTLLTGLAHIHLLSKVRNRIITV